MKVKIKSFKGELPSYLTLGKVYHVDCHYNGDQKYPCVFADNKHHIVLKMVGCGHLNGGSWEIVE